MRNLIFLSLFLTVPMVGFAQADIRFGFEASPFLSWMSTDSKVVKNDGANVGFQIVMHGEYYFAENYALTAGLGIAFRNGGHLLHVDGGKVFEESALTKESFRTLDPNTSVQYKIQYVDIPLSFRMRTQEFGYVRYFAELPIFTIGMRTQARGDIGDSAESENEDISGDTPFFRMGWGVGGGVEYSITSTTSLVGGLYFNQSFTDVTSDSGADPSKAEINRLVLRLGVMF